MAPEPGTAHAPATDSAATDADATARWPLGVIVLALVLNVLWIGLLGWGAASAMEWFAGVIDFPYSIHSTVGAL